MDFGHLSRIEGVNFTLPPSHPKNFQTLQKFREKPEKKPSVYVGCPLWTEKGWVGKIFPPEAKEKDFLNYYGRCFNAVELNATHYRIPQPSVVAKWHDSVPEGFKFFPKILQEISHERRLVREEPLTAAFCESVRCFEEKLGTSFLQLPPYFSPREASVLERYISNFPTDVPLAVEFRHPDWFSDRAIFESTFDMLERYSVTSVITDTAGRRDVVHQRITTDTVFVRFKANNLHPSDFTRLEAWVVRLKEWVDAGLRTICFFIHTHNKVLSPELISYFIKKMNEVCGTSLSPCEFIRPAEQKNLF